MSMLGPVLFNKSFKNRGLPLQVPRHVSSLALGVALRISEVAEAAGTTLKVDGRLAGSASRELARAAASCTGTVIVDLSGLVFADEDGVSVLKELQALGAHLRNVPQYVVLLLELEAAPAAGRVLDNGRRARE